LPFDKVTTLIDAFVQVKNHLGSGKLAARDLTQHARAGRLTVAALWILPNGSKQVGILRPLFWQDNKILVSFPFDDKRDEGATVRGPPKVGHWYFFVGRRRLDRLYSTAAPSKPAAQRPSEKQSQPEDRKLTLLPDEPQFQGRWRPEDVKIWFKKIRRDHPRRPDEHKTEWAERLYDHMKNNFENPPWGDAAALRRRLNDPNYD
jgi:hypothetical protein